MRLGRSGVRLGSVWGGREGLGPVWGLSGVGLGWQNLRSKNLWGQSGVGPRSDLSRVGLVTMVEMGSILGRSGVKRREWNRTYNV